MNTREINGNQLMTLMVLFVVASAMLSNVGGNAGQNVWIVLIFCGSIFAIIFMGYHRMSKLNNHEGLPMIAENCLGKYVGKVVTFIYASFFFFRTIMVGNSLTDMVQATLMQGVDQSLPHILLLVTVVFAVLYGLKAIGRSSEIFFAAIIVCLIPFFLTAFSTGIFEYNNLTPVLAEGFLGIRQDILKIVFHPYCELLVFLMFFPFVTKKDQKKILKKGYIAILIGTLLMIFVDSTIVGILGPSLTQNFQFPFYNAMQLARLSGLLERLDPLATVIVILTGYIKGVVYFYATILAFQSLHKKMNFTWPLILVTLLILIFAPYIRFDKYREYYIYVFPIFHIAIPLVLWFISEILHYKNRKKEVKNLG